MTFGDLRGDARRHFGGAVVIQADLAGGDHNARDLAPPDGQRFDARSLDLLRGQLRHALIFMISRAMTVPIVSLAGFFVALCAVAVIVFFMVFAFVTFFFMLMTAFIMIAFLVILFLSMLGCFMIRIFVIVITVFMASCLVTFFLVPVSGLAMIGFLVTVIVDRQGVARCQGE
jgi:hypothetical protein